MTREQLIDAIWSGDMGEVEFTEVALDQGLSLAEINAVLIDIRAEDGVDQ
jgi:hypothetical protein